MATPDSLLTGKRCLVLDDEFLIALDIQQTLELAGAAYVACVATAAEAFALLRARPDFDIAVLDVKLSGPERTSLGIAALLACRGTTVRFPDRMRVDDVHAKHSRKRRSLKSLTTRRRCWAQCAARSGSADQKGPDIERRTWGSLLVRTIIFVQSTVPTCAPSAFFRRNFLRRLTLWPLSCLFRAQ